MASATINIWRLTIARGVHFYLSYRNDRFWQLQGPDQDTALFGYFMAEVPQQYRDLKDFNAFMAGSKGVISFAKKELTDQLSVQDKISMFCQFFKHYRKVAYRPNDNEKSNLKRVKMSPDLLHTFFQTPGLTNYTLYNYKSRINMTHDFLVNGFPGEQFPSDWNPDFWKSLGNDVKPKYEQSLVANGYEKKYSPTAGTYFVQTDNT